jgi:pimeloyl-ACP methyl ester carboxylesterase
MNRHVIAVACLFLCLTPALALAERIGIVLIHGKQGSPDARHLAYIAQQIEGAGFLLDRPTMCWSRTRIYDRTIVDCMTDIDASIARLKSRGATGIAIVGHSLGGLGALYYGSQHEGLKGVAALAPAPPPGFVRRPDVANSVQRAQTLIAGDHGDEFQTFTDSNSGPRGATAIEVRATANVFLSFTEMRGPANLVNDAVLQKGPVLWVSGKRDSSQLPRESGFDRLPANPLNRYLLIDAGHIDTPDAAANAVVAWLQDVTKN